MKIYFTSKGKSKPDMILNYAESPFTDHGKSGDQIKKNLKEPNQNTRKKIANLKIDIFENLHHELSFAVSINEVKKQMKNNESRSFSSFSLYKSENDIDNGSEEKIQNGNNLPKKNPNLGNEPLHSRQNEFFFTNEKKKSEGEIVSKKFDKNPHYPNKNEKQKCRSKSRKVFRRNKEAHKICSLITLGKRKNVSEQEGKAFLQ